MNLNYGVDLADNSSRAWCVDNVVCHQSITIVVRSVAHTLVGFVIQVDSLAPEKVFFRGSLESYIVIVQGNFCITGLF